jgi:hypothetical protein
MLEENAFAMVPLHELKKPVIIDSPDNESYARMRRYINDCAVVITRSDRIQVAQTSFNKMALIFVR